MRIRRRQFLQFAAAIVSGFPFFRGTASKAHEPKRHLFSDDDAAMILVSASHFWHAADPFEAIRRPSIDPALIVELRDRWQDPNFDVSDGYNLLRGL